MSVRQLALGALALAAPLGAHASGNHPTADAFIKMSVTAPTGTGKVFCSGDQEIVFTIKNAAGEVMVTPRQDMCSSVKAPTGLGVDGFLKGTADGTYTVRATNTANGHYIEVDSVVPGDAAAPAEVVLNGDAIKNPHIMSWSQADLQQAYQFVTADASCSKSYANTAPLYYTDWLRDGGTIPDQAALLQEYNRQCKTETQAHASNTPGGARDTVWRDKMERIRSDVDLHTTTQDAADTSRYQDFENSRYTATPPTAAAQALRTTTNNAKLAYEAKQSSAASAIQAAGSTTATYNQAVITHNTQKDGLAGLWTTRQDDAATAQRRASEHEQAILQASTKDEGAQQRKDTADDEVAAKLLSKNNAEGERDTAQGAADDAAAAVTAKSAAQNTLQTRINALEDPDIPNAESLLTSRQNNLFYGYQTSHDQAITAATNALAAKEQAIIDQEADVQTAANTLNSATTALSDATTELSTKGNLLDDGDTLIQQVTGGSLTYADYHQDRVDQDDATVEARNDLNDSEPNEGTFTHDGWTIAQASAAVEIAQVAVTAYNTQYPPARRRLSERSAKIRSVLAGKSRRLDSDGGHGDEVSPCTHDICGHERQTEPSRDDAEVDRLALVLSDAEAIKTAVLREFSEAQADWNILHLAQLGEDAKIALRNDFANAIEEYVTKKSAKSTAAQAASAATLALSGLQGELPGLQSNLETANLGTTGYQRATGAVTAANDALASLRQEQTDKEAQFAAGAIELGDYQTTAASRSTTAAEKQRLFEVALGHYNSAVTEQTEAAENIGTVATQGQQAIATALQSKDDAAADAAAALKAYTDRVAAVALSLQNLELDYSTASSLNDDAVGKVRLAFEERQTFSPIQDAGYTGEKKLYDDALVAAKAATQASIAEAARVQSVIEAALVTEIKTFEATAGTGKGLTLYWDDEVALRNMHAEVEVLEVAAKGRRAILDGQAPFPVKGASEGYTIVSLGGVDDADYQEYTPTALTDLPDAYVSLE
jgi:hypothetical protein